MKRSFNEHHIFLVTGGVQSGKTTFVSSLVERLRRDRLKVAGFLSQGIMKDGQRSGFTLVDLISGKQIPLASLNPQNGWTPFRRFFFNPEAWEEAESMIRDGLLEKPDLIVIDEVGPMELQGEGWSKILENLAAKRPVLQLWVVRKQCLQEVTDLWKIPQEYVFSIDTDGNNITLDALSAKLTEFITP
jgi:iron complex transport system ATP-binding protein